MSFRNIFLFTFIFLLFTGCTTTKPLPPLSPLPPQEDVKIKEATSKELLLYPQNANFLAQNITSQNVAQEDFTYRYYSPWLRTKMLHKKDDALWANRSYSLKNRYYGENLHLIADEEIDAIIDNTNFEAFDTTKTHAIMLQNAQMRNLPTHKPFFRKPTLAGEGYPFDYLQTSQIHIGEPIFISHYSKDRAWAFIESSFATGWLPVKSFVAIDANQRTNIINSKKIALLKDNMPIYETNGAFVEYAKIGAIFPLEYEDSESFYIFLHDAKSQKISVRITKDSAKQVPFEFNQENALTLANALLGEKYGWGGYLANRDCSSMTRDYLAPFGIWAPRNSAAQKNYGKTIDLKNLDLKEKEEMILKNGIAFLSLVYLKGHIMLYAGEFEGKPLVLHNIWGIRTIEQGVEGRNVVGKAVISDLNLGENQPNVQQNSLLANKVETLLVTPSTTPRNHALLKYPSITSVKNNNVYFADGTTLPYDDGKTKSLEEKLSNADIEDHFAQSYPAFAPIREPELNFDAGRFRNDAFLKKLYGSTQKEIEKNLTMVTWLPKHGGKKLKFNKNENAAAQLQKVSNELDNLPEHFMKYLLNVDGTYTYRKIAKTDRLSAHSYGIAIDLDTAYSQYWQWDKKYHFNNQIPKEIVEIFEKHGFVWGGRWYHYDTMHFEYRPEMFETID